MLQQSTRERSSSPASDDSLTDSTVIAPSKASDLKRFQFVFRNEGQRTRVFHSDALRAGLAFINGEYDVEGHLPSAIRFWSEQAQQGWSGRLTRLLFLFSRETLQSFVQSKQRAADNIRFHYDVSNAFYQQFLDSRMVYSCGYFRRPDASLDEAQFAKLDHICRKLDLKPSDEFLDVGCGWGGLVLHAAGRYGATSTGCTLSDHQHAYAKRKVMEQGLSGRVHVHECDYRDVTGTYDKIASVGMYEHVGLRRLASYFRRIAGLLRDDGLFLNHGIIRPQNVHDGAETVFLRRKIFPGGELPHLGDVIRCAEDAGFEVLDVENLRPHYAMTCDIWVQRLKQHRDECLKIVDPVRYRTWLLYLASCAMSFSTGVTDVYQILMAKRGRSAPGNLTREYMYVG